MQTQQINADSILEAILDQLIRIRAISETHLAIMLSKLKDPDNPDKLSDLSIRLIEKTQKEVSDSIFADHGEINLNDLLPEVK